MPKERVLTGVPESDVEEVIADFESDGAEVVKERQTDGTYTTSVQFNRRFNIACNNRCSLH